MKTRLLISLLVAAGLAAPLIAHAQASAPDSLASSVLSVAVVSGQAPFGAKGTYRIFTSVTGANYTVLGPGGPLTSGLYSYSKASPAGGVATLADVEFGSGISMDLSFASATNGAILLTNLGGFQTGTFTLAGYAESSPPQWFLPALGSGQFQSCFSGQPGFVYEIDVSTNLANWQPWVNMPLTDLTAAFSDAPGSGTRFFRARIVGTAFAPEDLTNTTLNLTIHEGASPLATNGICQWLSDSNDLGYQLVAGPGGGSGAGTYRYTKEGDNNGLLTYLDGSSGGQFNGQLFFTAPSSGYFYLTNTSAQSAGFEAGSFTMADGAVEFLGNVQFTPDTGHAGSLVVGPDISPVRLNVTNAAGWVWTLEFPGDALTEPETITITPFAAVDSSQSLVPLTNGVSLEPDGLQFCDGVTLTATPPGAFGPYAALLMAGADGSGLQFVDSTNQGGSLSTTLFHFTSAGVTDPSASQWAAFVAAQLPKAQAAYAQASNDIHALMKNATSQPPPPPDYPWSCATTNPGAELQIARYITNLFAKENDAVSRLVSAAAELKSFGKSPGTNATALLKKLIETDEFAQVNTLFARYYTSDASNSNLVVFVNGNSYKLMALYRLSSGVNQKDQSFGGKGNTNWLTLVKNWSKGILTGCLQQVKDSHLYSLAPVALSVQNFRYSVLNVTSDTTGGFQTKLGKALTFKLNMDINFTDAAAPMSIEAQGVIANLAAGGVVGPPTPGTGEIDYLSGTAGLATLVQGQSFMPNASVLLNLCQDSPTATISLDRFGANTELWMAQDGTVGPVAGILQKTCPALFWVNGYGSLPGPWSFTFSSPDGQGEATASFDAALNGADATLKLILYHTPQSTQ
ncbi:MAG: hypothetical protein ACLQVY_21195 [Limisphaerales bacterium]